MTTGYGTPGMEIGGGRVPSEPGSHPSGHAASGVDGAPRFDPSRDDEFWGPEIVVNGVKPEWLAPQEPYVWLRTSQWLQHLRTRHSYQPPMAASTARWWWRHDDGRPCIRAIRLPAGHAAYLCDSDRSGEAGETALAGSTEGESAGPKDIAQTSEVNND